MPRPEWWQWELEFTPHLEKRMEDRGFSEIDLRVMVQQAHSHRRDVLRGRVVLNTRHRSRAWEVIVEPDAVRRTLVIITAYPVIQ